MPDLQVLALDTVAPQIRAPGVGDGYAVPRNMTMGASTQFFAAAGTAALPSLTTVGDPNTGLYFPVADAVSIATAGVERLRVTPLGDIGIGITPGSFFTIQTGNGYSNFKGASIGSVTIGASSTEYPSIGYNVRYTSTTNSYQYSGTDTANLIRFTNGTFQFLQAASGAAGTAITFNTRMVLDTNGSLGMSITPPAWAATARAVDFSFPSFGMDTAGAAIVGFNAYNSAGTTWNYKSADEAALFTIDTAGGFTWRQAVAGTTGAAITFNTRMALDSSGRFMVGTTTPSGIATFKQDQNAPTILQVNNGDLGTSATCRLDIGTQGGTAYIEARRDGGNMALFVNGADRVLCTASGSVVVGNAAVTTTAIDGFLYIPGCAGTPTGTPTARTGRVPLVVDTTNNKLYFYSGGAWRDAGP